MCILFHSIIWFIDKNLEKLVWYPSTCKGIPVLAFEKCFLHFTCFQWKWNSVQSNCENVSKHWHNSLNCILTGKIKKFFQMISELFVMRKTTGKHFFQPFSGQCSFNYDSCHKTKHTKLLLLEFKDGTFFNTSNPSFLKFLTFLYS